MYGLNMFEYVSMNMLYFGLILVAYLSKKDEHCRCEWELVICLIDIYKPLDCVLYPT